MVDPELEEQMKMLEGFDLDMTPSSTIAPNNVVQPTNTQPVQSAQQVQQVVQNNANMQAAAQVVQPTTTQPIPNTVEPAQAQPIPNYAPVSQPVQPAISQPVQPQPAQAQPNVMDSAPVFVDLNAATYQTKTNFLTVKDGEKTRVTLANLNFVRSHIHWIDGLGRIRCLSTYDDQNRWPTFRAACCQKVNDKTGKPENAKNRLLVPVIEYPVSKQDGKTIIQGAEPTLKMWDMNYVEEKSLLEILDNYKSGDNWNIDLGSFDLALSKSKQGDYSTIVLVPMAPSWRPQFNGKIEQIINSITPEFYNDAYKESAKVVSEEAILKTLNQSKIVDNGVQQLQNQTNNIPNINDILNI